MVNAFAIKCGLYPPGVWVSQRHTDDCLGVEAKKMGAAIATALVIYAKSVAK